MRIAKSFIQRTSLNLSHINQSSNIEPLQYNILVSKYLQPRIIQVPHYYSNKYDPIKMINTLNILYEKYRSKKIKLKNR